jgi:hypothetical protein
MQQQQQHMQQQKWNGLENPLTIWRPFVAMLNNFFMFFSIYISPLPGVGLGTFPCLLGRLPEGHGALSLASSL